MIHVAEGIKLLPLSVDYIETIFNLLNDERDYMREWLPFVDTTHAPEDTAAFVNSALQSDNEHFVISYKDKIVGLIGFKDIDSANRRTEIGYWLSQYAQGNGIMFRSVQRLLVYAFEELAMNRIQIRVAVENQKSRNIPEKLGFLLEGIERDGELLVENKYTDIAIYSLLKREYK